MDILATGLAHFVVVGRVKGVKKCFQCHRLAFRPFELKRLVPKKESNLICDDCLSDMDKGCITLKMTKECIKETYGVEI